MSEPRAVVGWERVDCSRGFSRLLSLTWAEHYLTLQCRQAWRIAVAEELLLCVGPLLANKVLHSLSEQLWCASPFFLDSKCENILEMSWCYSFQDLLQLCPCNLSCWPTTHVLVGFGQPVGQDKCHSPKAGALRQRECCRAAEQCSVAAVFRLYSCHLNVIKLAKATSAMPQVRRAGER